MIYSGPLDLPPELPEINTFMGVASTSIRYHSSHLKMIIY